MNAMHAAAMRTKASGKKRIGAAHKKVVAKRNGANSNGKRSASVRRAVNLTVDGKKAAKLGAGEANAFMGQKDLTDLFGYSDFVEAIQDVVGSVGMQGSKGKADMMGGNMGGDIMKEVMRAAKEIKGNVSSFMPQASHTQQQMRDSLSNTARMATESVRGMSDVRDILQQGTHSFLEAQREWFQDSTRNYAGFMKDIMKSASSQDKLDSLYGYLMSQVESNLHNILGRLRSRYIMLSKLIATQEGHTMGFARDAYDSVMKSNKKSAAAR